MALSHWHRFPYRLAHLRALFAALALGGCASAGDRIQPAVPVLDAGDLPALAEAAERLGPAPAASETSTEWWTSFGDPILDELVAQASEQAVDVRLALGNFDLALAERRRAGASLWPTVSLDADLAGNQLGRERSGLRSELTTFETSLALSAGWQVDLFGAARGSLKAAELRAGSAEALVRDVQRLVIADVVSLYVDLRAVQARQVIVADSIVRRAEEQARVEQLLVREYGTLVDLRRAESQLFEAQAQLAELRSLAFALINQLAVLTGQPIEAARAVLLDSGALADAPIALPAPDLATVLVQRPDVRAAERLLRAAVFDVDAAYAAQFPTLDLSASVGGDGADLGSVPGLSFVSGRFLSGLVVPLLGRGRILASIDAGNARLDQSLAEYEDTVLRALAELDTALASFVQSHERLSFRRKAADAAAEAATLSQQLFRAGEISYVSVIVAEDTRTASEDAAVLAQRDVLAAYIQYMAAAMPAW